MKNKSVDTTEREMFWKFISTKKTFVSCNYKFLADDKMMFSKNHFVSSFEEFENFAKKYGDLDCYCTYNPMLKKTNRKLENLSKLRLMSLDIEFKDKKKNETAERMEFLSKLVERFIIKDYHLSTFLMNRSGNGIHLFISIGKPFKIDSDVRHAYKALIKEIESTVNASIEYHFDCGISISDRVDMNGILRIPGTKNTKCDKNVCTILADFSEENTFIRKLFLKHVRIAKKHSVLPPTETEVSKFLIPTTFEELENHIFVRSIFDTSLPEVDGWHQTVIFALQAVVKASGLPYDADMRKLEDDINSSWNMSVSLSCCSTDDVLTPIIGAYNFYKKNNFEKYRDELRRLLDK